MATEAGQYDEDGHMYDTTDFVDAVNKATAAAAAGSGSALDARTVLWCLAAALVSAGVLIKTLQPRLQGRKSSRKQRDHVVKKIQARQQQQQARASSSAPPPPSSTPATSRAAAHGHNAAQQAAASSSTPTLLHRLSSMAIGAVASTSAVTLDSPEPQLQAQPQSTQSDSEPRAHPRTGHASLQDASAAKKSKPRKSKGAAQSSASSSAVNSPAIPHRRLSAVTLQDLASTAARRMSDAGVQTSPRTPSSALNGPDSAAPTNESRLSRSLTPSPSTKPALCDAGVQTSPGFADTRIRRPSFNQAFDLHASFQTTPELRSYQFEASPFSRPRSPGSPSPTMHLDYDGSSRGRAKSPSTLHSAAVIGQNHASSSSSTTSPGSSRSRKQARKASASAAAAGSERVVVGLHRPVRTENGGVASPNEDSRRSSPQLQPSAMERTASSGTTSSKASAASAPRNPPLPASQTAYSDNQPLLDQLGHIRKMSTSSGKRQAPPPPIPLEQGVDGPDSRRSSMTGDASSMSGSSLAASPYFKNNLSMTTSALAGGDAHDVRRRSSDSGGRSDDPYWQLRRENEGSTVAWDGSGVGLGMGVMGNGNEPGDAASSSTGSRKDGSSGSTRDTQEGSRSWSSGTGSSPNLPSLTDGYFPAGPHTALTTPDSSPHPSNRQLLSMTSMSGQKQQWQPSSSNYLPRNPNGPPQPSAPTTRSQGPRPQTTRQPSLSVSLPPSTMHHVAQNGNQQQAYAAMFAQAQAQYQHVLALQYQAQQVHHRQQQVAAARQRLEIEQGMARAAAAAAHQQQHGPSTPSGLVYPISSNGPRTPLSMPGGTWTAQISPGAYNGYPFGSFSQSASPTAAAFPQVASSYGGPSTPYYVPSPTHSGFPVAPPPIPHRQSVPAPSVGGGSGKRDGKKPARPGHDRARSASASAMATLSSLGLSSTAASQASPASADPPPSPWRSKVKAAELDADRAAKELEIARWRVSVLEQEQRLIELENQEALRVLAARALRAENRLKAFEGTKGKDSEHVDISDASADASVDGKIHPLSWLDLDTVTFNSQSSTAASRPAFLAQTTRRRSGRSGASRRSGANRRRAAAAAAAAQMGSTEEAPPTPAQDLADDDDDEEEVLIVLDSPLARRDSLPASLNGGRSRSPSFVMEEFSMLHHDGTALGIEEGDESISADLYVDEDSDERSLRDVGDVSYIGSLPTFLQPPGGSSSRSPSLPASSPRRGSLRDSEGWSGEDTSDEAGSSVGVRRGVQPLSLDTDKARNASIPSLHLDCATPDAHAIAHSPLENVVVAAGGDDDDGSGESLSRSDSSEKTPKVPSAPSPAASDEGTAVDIHVAATAAH